MRQTQQGSVKARVLPKAQVKRLVTLCISHAERVPKSRVSGFKQRGGTRKDKQHQENSHFDAEQARKVWMMVE